MKIAIGADHAGFDIKESIKQYLSSSYTIIDCGTNSIESVDYPKFGHLVAKAVSDKDVDAGIVVCGSGIGISIAANKVKGVRAALCTSVEHAKMSKRHNNANVLALGARMNTYDDIIMILNAWLESSFEGGRHQDRIEKIEII